MYAESMCLLRDLNGDGVPDVAVGCPGASGEAGDWCGKVEILSGRDFALIREVWGTKGGQRFGTRVISSGVTGSLENGVVGVLLEDPKTGHRGAVVFNADMTTKRWEITPNGEYEGLGMAIQPCPDLDGDGVPEIGVPATWAVKDHRVVGRYSICSGKSGRVLFSCWGTEEYEFFGSSATVMASTGAEDRFLLAIGSPAFKRGGQPLGRVQVIGVPSNRRVYERLGTTVGAHYGHSVISVGGVNGSGRVVRDALAVASVSIPADRAAETHRPTRGGNVEVFAVGDDTPVFSIEGLQTWRSLGDFMEWSDAEGLLVLGAPASFGLPSLSAAISRSYLCVLHVGEPMRNCRVFTSQGEVPKADLGRFIRLD